MSEAVSILFNGFWCGVAALGFSILFNAPARSLSFIWIGGFLAGVTKFAFLSSAIGAGIGSASLMAALVVGFLSIPVAHKSHVPPVIFSIPCMIPMVPGAFAYRAMLGFMRLAGKVDENYQSILSETFHNASLTLFIILGISLGVAVPMLIFRRGSVKKLGLLKRRN